MLIDFARQLSFLIFSFGCSGVYLFFVHLFYHRRTFSSGFKACGFGLLGASSFVNFFNHMYTTISFWFATIAYLLIFFGIIFDKHSKFRLLFPIPLIAIYFLRNHQLLYTLAFLVLVAHIYLSFNINHKRLIPLVGAFSLVVAGEYIYSLKGLSYYPPISDAGVFIYLFAALVLNGWILSYLIRALVDLLRGTNSVEPLD